MGFPSIDWTDLLAGYNRIYKANFKTVEEMMKSLYGEHKGLIKISNILGPSVPTISRKLKSFKIEVNSKGWTSRKPVKENLLLKIPKEKLKEMSKIEIIRETGLSLSYLDKLITKHYLKIRVLPRSGGRHYAAG